MVLTSRSHFFPLFGCGMRSERKFGNTIYQCSLEPLRYLQRQIQRSMPDDFQYISILPIIEIDDWDVADEPLGGSRAKNTVIDPETETTFVFKEPKAHREAQIWSELLASFIAGDLLGWPVQHVSLGRRGDRLGNLMQYIYDDGSETFTEGWQLCRGIDPDYDIERGYRHTLALLMSVGADLERRGLPQGDYYQFWGRAFALDALISNSDRHAENWAVVEKAAGLRMAPLYDNATSMGCEWSDESLERRWFTDRGVIQSSKLKSYVDNGRNHVRAGEPSRRGSPFTEVCEAFLAQRPEQSHVFATVADLDLQPVFTLMAEIVDIEGLEAPFCMSQERRRQIEALLKKGQERIKNILDKE